MKLLKIGRSSQCDIVLQSPNVSSYHAEIIILDNGEIFVSDKNSTNGTFVAGSKISPNVEVPIHRGDHVVFADSELQWGRVPKPEDNSEYKNVVNIGTNFRNEIQLQNDFCSRFHAVVKISKNGKKAFIKDLNSRNGVKVDGIKIQPNTDVAISCDSKVTCADEDITKLLLPYLPKKNKWIIPTVISVAAAACVLLLIGLIDVRIDPNKMADATVYLYSDFEYVVTLNDNPIKDTWDGTFVIDNDLLEQYGLPRLCSVSGTGFFIDNEGRIGTNRHIAFPWHEDYIDDETRSLLREVVSGELDDMLQGVDYLSKDDYYNYHQLQATKLGGLLDEASFDLAELNSFLNRLYRSTISISGRAQNRYVGYPKRQYTHLNEMERYDLIAVPETDEKDVAILQLNTKKTPDHISLIFDVNKFFVGKIEPLKDRLYTIGYPGGLVWNLDNTSHSLDPSLNYVQCSKDANQFNIELQGKTFQGASGSPVFNDKGHLVGILFGGREQGAVIAACRAIWLKELYENSIGVTSIKK